MKHVGSIALTVVAIGLSGCADLQSPAPKAAPTVSAAPVTAPPPRARTVEEFDTTTAADRAKALDAKPNSAAERPLGATLATLGSPIDPGIWLKTPLVSEVTQGRVIYRGQSINVELRPSDGPEGSGSQISLSAMQLLNAPLTAIIEISVFAL